MVITYLNNNINPYVSKIMPNKGHPTRTRTIPRKKDNEALSLCLCTKNLNVLSNPITQVKPAINSI